MSDRTPAGSCSSLFGRLMPARRLVAATASWRSGMSTPAGEVCQGDLAGPPVASAVAALQQDGISLTFVYRRLWLPRCRTRPQSFLLWRARLAYALLAG